MKIAIVIPAYNEEPTIKEVITRFHNECREAAVYVIDNNSKDRTNEIARQTIEELGIEGRVIFEGRQGKGNAMRRAFRDVEADVYVMTDADLTYPESDLKKLMQPIIDGQCDMTVGDRISEGKYSKENKRLFHNFGNSLVRSLINLLWRAKLKDIMTGYRAFNRFFVKNFPVLSEGFEIETEMTLHTLDKKFRIKEIPINYIDRPEGSESKLNTFSDGYKILKTIFTIFKNYKPFGFFGALSILFGLAGLATGFPVIKEFIETQYILHVPLAILATGLMILAGLFFAIALILDTVVKGHKFNYELHLNQFIRNRKEN